MDKNRIGGVRAGRAGKHSRLPYPSKVQNVDSATVHGRRLCLPQEICSVSLRRLRLSKGGLTAGQKSAEGILGRDVGKASEQLTAKPISIKGAKRRFGDCAWKAAVLTPGDLLRVASATEAVERRLDRGAEVSRGHSRS